MLHVKDVVGPLVVGEYYLVDTVRLSEESPYEPDAGIHHYHQKVYIIPVLGPAHKDDDEAPHVHLDQRFMGGKLLKKFGIALFVMDVVFKIQPRSMRCVRSCPDVPVIVARFKERYQGKCMKNKVCPHKGTYLGNVEPVNGCVTCPTHGLTFRCDTGELTEPPEMLLDRRMIQKFRRLGRARLNKDGTVAL